MKTIKIYLAQSGGLAELKKDFPLYQGAFNNTLLNVYVPTSILPGILETQYIDETGFVHTEQGTFTALKIGMVAVSRDGRISKTNAFYMRYLKTIVYQGIEYALYERALPQAFTIFQGQATYSPKLIINVVNMQNNNTYENGETILGEPKILQTITSQECNLEVLPSTNFDRDELIIPSEWEILNGKVDDLYLKYDNLSNKVGNLNNLETDFKDNLVGAINEVRTFEKDYVDEKLEDYYDKTESDERFVHLQGDESIDGVKTFTDKILVEDPTSNKMAVNRQTMQGYTYSKEEINNLTTPIGFETEQNFLNWLGGTFTRPDGILPSDLLIGKKIIIQEEGKNNYQVAEVPVVDLSDFKVLVEDNKFAEEIGFKPYETIEADNVQDAVEEVKDEVDLKTQIVRLDNLVIESNEWVEEDGEVYFDHMIPEFTNSLEQEIEIVNNNKTQSDLFIAEQITVKAVETIGVEPNLGIRLILNKAPSETITLSVFMSNSTNITFEAGEVVAKNVFYDNTASGLIADNVQDAVDELKILADEADFKASEAQNHANFLEQDKISSGLRVQQTGTSQTAIMSQNAVTTQLNTINGTLQDIETRKIDKVQFEGQQNDIYYNYDGTGSIGKLQKGANNSFLSVAANGLMGWQPLKTIHDVTLTVAETGLIESTNEFYSDGFRRYYNLNISTPTNLDFGGLFYLEFTNTVRNFPGLLLYGNGKSLNSNGTLAYTEPIFDDSKSIIKLYVFVNGTGSLTIASSDSTDHSSSFLECSVEKYTPIY